MHDAECITRTMMATGCSLDGWKTARLVQMNCQPLCSSTRCDSLTGDSFTYRYTAISSSTTLKYTYTAQAGLEQADHRHGVHPGREKGGGARLYEHNAQKSRKVSHPAARVLTHTKHVPAHGSGVKPTGRRGWVVPRMARPSPKPTSSSAQPSPTSPEVCTSVTYSPSRTD
jgi:hypothetical protein